MPARPVCLATAAALGAALGAALLAGCGSSGGSASDTASTPGGASTAASASASAGASGDASGSATPSAGGTASSTASSTPPDPGHHVVNKTLDAKPTAATFPGIPGAVITDLQHLYAYFHKDNQIEINVIEHQDTGDWVLFTLKDAKGLLWGVDYQDKQSKHQWTSMPIGSGKSCQELQIEFLAAGIPTGVADGSDSPVQCTNAQS